MAFKIAAWNVNSILARLPTALKVFEDVGADIWCLQEIKCEDARFPRFEFEAMGYNIETYGQKSYNGVAILSKHRIEETIRGVPGLDHEHARYIEAVIAAPGGPVRALFRREQPQRQSQTGQSHRHMDQREGPEDYFHGAILPWRSEIGFPSGPGR